MKYIIKITLVLSICISLFTSCGEFLDVVPDGAPTIENTFSNRVNAERFLFTCFNGLPNSANPFTYPGHVGGDEIWYDIDDGGIFARSGSRIARNDQNSADPFQNFWEGRRDGVNLWIAIRNCNTFLENINSVPDVPSWEKKQWSAEVKFIKAYLHFFLLQIYGPIPVMRDNVDVTAEAELIRVYREPVDDVIEYIVSLLDESMVEEGLPLYIVDVANDMGRPTRAIAASVKAKALVWAASPLFNGNTDYANFKDNRGIQLIPQVYDSKKWERAAIAIKEAIDISHEAGHSLFEFIPSFADMSPQTKLKYTLRGAVTERLGSNPEIIWGEMRDNRDFTRWCIPNFFGNANTTCSELSATLKIAEQYYTQNGVPIDEDKNWNYAERYETKTNSDNSHQYYIASNFLTAKLNFNREPRFHAYLAFDGSLYEMYNSSNGEQTTSSGGILQLTGQAQGTLHNANHIITGYFIKKIVSYRSAYSGSSASMYRNSMPIIRLSDLYLLYAEALNETKSVPDNEVYEWIDIIRNRAGLKGVVESWSNYSTIPGKPATKDGMREIIKRERLIELSFEGQRFFDLRRWKDALKYINEPIRGWNYKASQKELYYQITTYYERKFTLKDYFWPIYANTLVKNSNLVQNPGW